jgi:amino-acid N-acetyltransferase
MSAFTIRPAIETDQPVIRRMIREAGINPMSLNWPNFIVAEEGGRTVGVAQVKRHRDGSRELASVAVVPERQGEGIGSALVRELVARHGHDVLHLTCLPARQGYYERFGFRRLERSEYPPYFRRLVPVFNSIGRMFGQRIIVMHRDPGA